MISEHFNHLHDACPRRHRVAHTVRARWATSSIVSAVFLGDILIGILFLVDDPVIVFVVIHQVVATDVDAANETILTKPGNPFENVTSSFEPSGVRRIDGYRGTDFVSACVVCRNFARNIYNRSFVVSRLYRIEAFPAMPAHVSICR